MKFSVSLQRTDSLHIDASVELDESLRFIGLSGPSGAGKTSILRALAALEPTATVNKPTARVGLVFQDGVLFEHLSVKDNLKLAAEFAPVQAFTWDEVMTGCVCEHLLSRFPHQLSGGEVQRVAIARTLLNGPDWLLLDESLSAMDAGLKRSVLSFLHNVSQQVKILWVSHDWRELALHAQALVLIDNGVVKAQGLPQYVLSALASQHPDDALFSVLEGDVVTDSGAAHQSFVCEGHTLYATAPYIDGTRARIVVEAADVSLDRAHDHESSIVNALRCTIARLQAHSASQVLVSLQCGRTTLSALISQLSCERMALAAGDEVTARFKLR